MLTADRSIRKSSISGWILANALMGIDFLLTEDVVPPKLGHQGRIPMGIRKFASKTMALALAFSLLSVGLAPAKTICVKAINDPKEANKPLLGSAINSLVNLYVLRHKDFKNTNVHDPGHDLIPVSTLRDSSCHEGPTTAPCALSIFFQALQGPDPRMSRAKRSLSDEVVLISLDIRPNHHALAELVARKLMIPRSAPVPLYIQNFSLLC
jgi:hypothetical protein